MPEPIEKPFKRVLLHIGLHKTGTTTIQHFLFSNRAALQRRGFYVPSATSRGFQHIELAQLFRPRHEHLEKLTGIGSAEIDARRDTVARAFAAEIADVGGGHTLLISSEHLGAAPAAIDAYKQFFAPYADQFESLMYLRRQDRWNISAGLQARQTGARADINLTVRSPRQFERTVRLWDEASDRCHIRRFDTEFLVHGSLLEDFCEIIGCGITGLDTEMVFNSAIRQEQLELVDALNGALAMPFDQQIAYRSRFLPLCTDVLGGSRFEYSRAEAQATFEAYAKINTWLRETRDPDGPAFFFNTDFSDYPIEARNDRAYTIEQLLELAAVIQGRLRGRGRDIPSEPDATARACVVSYIVSCFIRLHDAEMEEARAAWRAVAVEERRRARLAGQADGETRALH